MKRISYILAVILLVLVGYFSIKDRRDGLSFEPASKEKLNLTFESLDGRKVSISEYEGKVVLVNFWATWCPPCKEEMPLFEDIQNKYRDKNFQIVAINMDTNESALREYVRTNNFSFDIYKGNQEDLRNLGISGFPTSYLLDKEGKVCKVKLGIYKEVEEDIKELIEKGGKC